MLVGGLAFGVNFGLTYALTEWLGWWYLGSVVVGTVVSWVVFFTLNFYVTFPERLTGRFWFGLLKNFSTQLSLAPIGWGLIYLATSVFGWHYLVSLTTVVALVSLASFGLNHHFVFKVKS